MVDPRGSGLRRRGGVRPRVLIVEDDPGMRGVMLIYLKHLGYVADTVANGLEAVDAVRTGLYGLILLDCVMPELEGIETARRIRAMELPKGQPGIVAFTALMRPATRRDCLVAGMDAFLAKPFTEGELQEALETALGERIPEWLGDTVVANVEGNDEEGGVEERVRVILVDDDASVRHFVFEALTASGYEVVQVASGEDAQCLLDGEQRPYDLLIVDVVMPGMSGPDFARWLRERHPATRVLYITGYPEETARQYGLPLGGFDLLLKPFGVDMLRGRVARILGKGPM